MSNGAPLIEAYHVVFDHKDKLPDGPTKYLAYEAAYKIAELIAALGFEVPQRFDGEGR